MFVDHVIIVVFLKKSWFESVIHAVLSWIVVCVGLVIYGQILNKHSFYVLLFCWPTIKFYLSSAVSVRTSSEYCCVRFASWVPRHCKLHGRGLVTLQFSFTTLQFSFTTACFAYNIYMFGICLLGGISKQWIENAFKGKLVLDLTCRYVYGARADSTVLTTTL